ncbi:uncharacterized protein B0I36DRAFT_110419 [Microdochium trichocladiopsis]|uniref:Uncharacterized protein n=1 Tax=Microdochium trichocladiopsis TaxID=1682393 RepID=A0A9P8Y9Q0_9PEZI|nr:uncharacterized protein B0I36DRAFT_110419 [Microdochium trichocladiopsis]KAH7033558.1 hypothetical protein B0I36DRAFT_110419 [Microdochium trichocladiopsis]
MASADRADLARLPTMWRSPTVVLKHDLSQLINFGTGRRRHLPSLSSANTTHAVSPKRYSISSGYAVAQIHQAITPRQEVTPHPSHIWQTLGQRGAAFESRVARCQAPPRHDPLLPFRGWGCVSADTSTRFQSRFHSWSSLSSLASRPIRIGDATGVQVVAGHNHSDFCQA